MMNEQGAFRCRWCKATFDEPNIVSYEEDMNGEGAWFTWHELRCPECGSEEIDEIVEINGEES